MWIATVKCYPINYNNVEGLLELKIGTQFLTYVKPNPPLIINQRKITVTFTVVQCDITRYLEDVDIVCVIYVTDNDKYTTLVSNSKGEIQFGHTIIRRNI